MGVTLLEAARRTGRDKSTLRRQIKAGKLSATRDHNGTWLIEVAELERLHQVRSEDHTWAAPRDAPVDAATDALVRELKLVVEDLRRDRDAWRAQAERLALPAPTKLDNKFDDIKLAPRRPWWRWMRATG
jgi:hypothetical protein